MISPEQILREQLAGKAVGTFDSAVIDVIEIDERIRSPGTQLKLVRTTAPDADGGSPADADVRNRTGCTVVAVERDGSVVTTPGASFVIERDDQLVVAGTDENSTRFQTEFVRWVFCRLTTMQASRSAPADRENRSGGRLTTGKRRGDTIPRPRATA
ncbi:MULTISPECIES: cation:proton antiporter regulatory subunit [Haloarcula]|uniref:cation:proton antiporter regulatory subunit n=1 Tax=Haloarcula TaxID=2237 RepID=UPI0023EAB35B|nr:TrkA C-terminal domain-containing protein [Halomicroarcula sp. XH51]